MARWSWMGALSVRPRCSAALEEGRCHLTDAVPAISGIFVRSMMRRVRSNLGCSNVCQCTEWETRLASLAGDKYLAILWYCKGDCIQRVLSQHGKRRDGYSMTWWLRDDMTYQTPAWWSNKAQWNVQGDRCFRPNPESHWHRPLHGSRFTCCC